MEITETVRKIFQNVIVPELVKIREEKQKIAAILELANKRLDDVNTHLADQSPRIDEFRAEMTQRIDDTNQRIDEVRSELTQRMDNMHADLVRGIDYNNERIDRFFLAAATKEAQPGMEPRLTYLEREMGEIRQREAA